MALIRILVDGYSLLHSWPELAEGAPRHSEAARDALVEMLTQYQDASGTPVTVFFDGAGARRGKPKNQSSGAVEVLFSSGGQSADDLIEPEHTDADWNTRRKLATLMRLQARRVATPTKRIVFKFCRSPVAVTGGTHVTGLHFQTHDGSGSSGTMACGLLMRAIGYRGRALQGLPFDSRAGVISNIGGRVTDGSEL
ncbi:MAG: NYN domain-containing protein, partial [Verrucomicrobiota bacterium]